MVVYILFYRFLPHHRLVCALLMSCLRNPQRPLSCSVWLVGKHHAGAVFTELFERLTNLFICHYHRVGLREQVLRSLAFSLCMLCPPVADADITFLPCDFYLSIFFIPRLISAVGCLPYCDTWCGLSATLECMSETCCTRLAGNTARKKSPSAHRRTTLSGYIFANKACIGNRKNFLNSNIFSTRPRQHSLWVMLLFRLLGRAEPLQIQWPYNHRRASLAAESEIERTMTCPRLCRKRNEDTWSRYCCLTIFPIVDICLTCDDIARQSCAMVRRWGLFGDFLRPAFPARRFGPAS